MTCHVRESHKSSLGRIRQQGILGTQVRRVAVMLGAESSCAITSANNDFRRHRHLTLAARVDCISRCQRRFCSSLYSHLIFAAQINHSTLFLDENYFLHSLTTTRDLIGLHCVITVLTAESNLLQLCCSIFFTLFVSFIYF